MTDVWEPTMYLRWIGESGQLQQRWEREVTEWKAFGGKEYLCRRHEEEWRDIPRAPLTETQTSNDADR